MAQKLQDLAEVLRVVEERSIVPPLVVVQVLSRSEVTCVGLVKDWLLACIQTDAYSEWVPCHLHFDNDEYFFACSGRAIDCVVSG